MAAVGRDGESEGGRRRQGAKRRNRSGGQRVGLSLAGCELSIGRIRSRGRGVMGREGKTSQRAQEGPPTGKGLQGETPPARLTQGHQGITLGAGTRQLSLRPHRSAGDRLDARCRMRTKEG